MAHLLEDPRLRQRWNQFSHTTETVTENAAAGIYSFQHRYLNPCLASLGNAIEPCLAPCFGDRDERMRRSHQYHHHQYQPRQAEYTFDFYDDWDDDDELLASGGLGAGRGEDWDRLVGGSGSGRGRKGAGTAPAEVADQQPRRKRGMSYGTRSRKAGGIAEEDDPTIIPSTAPLGFLGRLPWKIGGTLRYKPSAAFLQDHPGAATTGRAGETQPLLFEDEDGDDNDGDGDVGDFRPHIRAHTRNRSGTSGSGDTSDSFRSRGDLFPSDGEEYEDAMEIDDEFAVALERVDDRASSNTRSSKGKRPAGGVGKGGGKMSRAASATTLSSSTSKSSLRARRASGEPSPGLEGAVHPILAVSIEDLQREEREAERAEDQEVARKREAAARVARERGLSRGEEDYGTGESESRAKSAMFSVEELSEPSSPRKTTADEPPGMKLSSSGECTARLQVHTEPGVGGQLPQDAAEDFIPARLPHFR